MSLIPPTYLTDPSGNQWLISVDNNATPVQTPLSVPVAYAAPYILLNSVTDGGSWSLTILTNGDLLTTPIPQGSYPTQLIVTAPNGVPYALQIATVGPPLVGSISPGTIQVALPADSSSYTCTTPISTLAANVLERLEENYPGGPIFWNLPFEIYTAIVEAMNDLMLLVGRPTQTVSMPFNLQPNTVWQKVPKGLYLISDIQGQQAPLRKYTLFSYDYEQPGGIGPDWENDTSPAGPVSWAPVGNTMFIVYPAPVTPQTVLLSGIAYPVAETNFPYSGAELVPFHHEVFQWLEMYGAHYARIKEGSQEFQESLSLYQSYLQGAKRLTELEDRRDPLIFSAALGAPAGVNPIKRR